MKMTFEMDEIWKEIKRFPNYAVSNFGRIKRISKDNNGHDNNTYIGKIRKFGMNSCGYKTIDLCKDGKCKYFTVHALVAKAFLGLCPKDKQINHIDGDKSNNCANNLEYVTKSENVKHAYKLGLMRQDGKNNTNSKLDEGIVLKIRRLYKSGFYTQEKIAKQFDISRPNVSYIVNNKIWSHI